MPLSQAVWTCSARAREPGHRGHRRPSARAPPEEAERQAAKRKEESEGRRKGDERRERREERRRGEERRDEERKRKEEKRREKAKRKERSREEKAKQRKGKRLSLGESREQKKMEGKGRDMKSKQIKNKQQQDRQFRINHSRQREDEDLHGYQKRKTGREGLSQAQEKCISKERSSETLSASGCCGDYFSFFTALLPKTLLQMSSRVPTGLSAFKLMPATLCQSHLPRLDMQSNHAGLAPAAHFRVWRGGGPAKTEARVVPRRLSELNLVSFCEELG